MTDDYIKKPREWVTAYGTNGRYEISNDGLIRSLYEPTYRGSRKRKSPKIKKCFINEYGYVQTVLATGSRSRIAKIHRLILESFVGPRPKLLACHRNGIKTDNRLENLYWGTYSDNYLDSVRHGTNPPRYGTYSGRTKLTDADILIIRDKKRCAAELAVKFNLNKATIYKIRNGKTWKHVKNVNS